MFCRNCGKPIKDGASFCTECGWKVSSGVSNAGNSGVSGQGMPERNMGNPGVSGQDMSNRSMGNPGMGGPNNVSPAGNINRGNMNRGNMNTGNVPARNMRPMNASGRPMPAPAKKKGNTTGIVIAAVFGSLAVVYILVMIIGFASVGFMSDDKEKIEETSGLEENVTKDLMTEDIGVADMAAVEELLAIMEETENADVPDWDSSTDTDTMIGNIDKWHEQIEDQYLRSQKLEGLPANMKKAAADSYEMYLSYIDCISKDVAFVKDIEELSKLMDQEDFVQMYYDMKDKIENTECPENMTDSWNEVEKSLDLYAVAVARYTDGENLKDSLRLYSADNLYIRFFTVFNRELNKVRSVIQAEMNFLDVQEGSRTKIFEEIKEAAGLDPDDIGEYKFKYNIDNVVADPTYSNINSIYPSLYNTYDSFLTVNIGCLHGERDIIIECEIPGVSQSMSQSYHIGPAMTALNIKPPALNGKVDFDIARDTQIKVSIKDKKDGSIIDTQSFPVHIYSRNDFEWDSDEFGTITKDNILCFLTPDSKAITELKRNAIDILEDMSGGEMDALAGYQGPYFAADEDGDGNVDNLGQAQYLTTYLQAAALMRSMSDMGVRYTNDAFSIDNAGQHILFPDQVLERKTGLCIETSLVIASALQSMGMHTCLIFPPGHAQVAVETWEGSGSYFLIETTALPNENSVFIDEANAMITNWGKECDNYPIAYLTKDEWVAYLTGDQTDDSDDCYVLDCGDGALLGMTPFAN